MSYRVQLPIFSGPMDLLLHLVRQQEVDIHEISIARILDDYLKHLGILQQLDLADIGDFVVMASTLMEMKSRELLPSEVVEIEQELDPRDDLIRRLLEYKRYRDLARQLEGRADHRARQSPLVIATPAHLVDQEDEDLLDLGNVGIWDLTSAFAKLLEEIGQQGTMAIEVEKRDVGFYTRRLLEQFRQQREWRFAELFDRSEGRYGLIGTLIALLELMKQGYLRAHQEKCTDEIHLAFRGEVTVTAEDVLAGITAEEDRARRRDEAVAEVLEQAEQQDLAAHGFDVGGNGLAAGPVLGGEPGADDGEVEDLVDDALDGEPDDEDEVDEEPTFRLPPRELGAGG